MGKVLPGVWFFDPGFMSTAACESAITYSRRRRRILRYRGYPIEQLAESSTYLEVAYLLLNGGLPDEEQFAAWRHDVTYHTFIHENVRKRFLEGFHYDAHPMGMLVSAVAALSTFYLDAKDIFDPESRSKQVVRLMPRCRRWPRRPTASASGCPSSTPTTRSIFSRPTSSPCSGRSPSRGSRPTPSWLGRSTSCSSSTPTMSSNCSTTAMRVPSARRTRTPTPPPPPAAAALYGPRHGGANEAVIRMLTDIGSIENVPDFIATVKAGTSGQRLQGFGHRVYKSYDPRAKIIKRTADEVFEVTGKNPLLDIALKLEEIALSDEYFTSGGSTRTSTSTRA